MMLDGHSSKADILSTHVLGKSNGHILLNDVSVTCLRRAGLPYGEGEVPVPQREDHGGGHRRPEHGIGHLDTCFN